MEEENKVQPTAEPNPTGDDEQVKASDLEEDGKKNDDAEAGDGGEENKADEPSDSKKEDKPQTPKQSRETDAQNAERRRRAKEREEQRQREREAEIRRQAVFEVKSGQVTQDELKELGLSKVEDEDQLFLVESLRKAKADGEENPEAKAYQELYKKHRADKADAEAKAKAEKEQQDRKKSIVAKDQADFFNEFGKTTAEVLKNEPDFVEEYGEIVDSEIGNFTKCYRAYLKRKAKEENEAKKQGSFPTNTNVKPKEDLSNESNEDFKKRWVAEHGRWR